MKRYFIKDEEGKVVEVSELEAGEEAPKAEAPAQKDEEGAAPAAPFTPEQMDAIRTIISEELAKLHKPEEKPAEEMHDEAEMKKEEEEKKEACDSKKTTDSAVSLENKKTSVSDSSLDVEEERANAWNKRFGLSK